jgi:hypothetical protein
MRKGVEREKDWNKKESEENSERERERESQSTIKYDTPLNRIPWPLRATKYFASNPFWRYKFIVSSTIFTRSTNSEEETFNLLHRLGKRGSEGRGKGGRDEEG